MFQIGQRVICIVWRPEWCGFGTETVPTAGQVYTVRGNDYHERIGAAIRLMEIRNPRLPYADGLKEAAFSEACFRSLTDVEDKYQSSALVHAHTGPAGRSDDTPSK